eukprot:SAG31_NODE_1625_length_7716_cov_23.849941_2_plen_90_part_00
MPTGTRARPDIGGDASPAPELAPGSPQAPLVSAVQVQASGGQGGVDPALLAALRHVVSSSVQTENALLTAQLGLVTSRLGALEGVAQGF